MSLENIPARTIKGAISKPASIRGLSKHQIKPFGKIGVYRHRHPCQQSHHYKGTISKMRVGGDTEKGIFPKKHNRKESKMTHTAELHIAITPEEHRAIITRSDVRWERDGDGKLHRHIRTLEPYGITDIKPKKIKTRGGYPYYYCIIIINLQRIVNNGARTIETYHREGDFEPLAKNFARFISSVLPLRTELNEWNLQRIDYNIDLKLTPLDVEQYITLLQRGNKNHSWRIHEFVDEKKKRQKSKHGHRKKTHPTGSVLFDNKQYSVNIYNKHLERVKVQAERGITDLDELQASEGVLRIEIQVKRNKLNAIKRDFDFDFAGKPIEIFARYDVASHIVMKALADITGRADYTTLENAKKRVISGVKAKRTQTAIIDFLCLVTQTKSIWRAKELFVGDVKAETILAHLARLNINPVTIPVSFKRDTMVNLFDIVAVQFAEERERATMSTQNITSSKI